MRAVPWTLVLLLAGALQVPAARAVTPAAPRTVDPRALAVQEVVVDFCAANDPVGATRVRAHLKLLVQGTDKATLDRVRQSTEYRGAHEAEVAFIDKVDKHNAHRLCTVPAAMVRGK